MTGRNKFWGLAICLGLLLMLVAPAFAGDRPVDKRDLKGISPHRHRYIFATMGGAAVGAGFGALIGGKGNFAKGLLIGGGGASALYLHSHRNTGGAYRDWLFIPTHTALGTGIGWTLCGCDNGALAGALIGGGGSAIWRAMAPQKGFGQVTQDVTQTVKDSKP